MTGSTVLKNLTQLAAKAKQAQKQAYAPYSQYHVGAAVLADSGKVYTGANVENVSYGLTVCAERIAIFKAVNDGSKTIRAIAVAAGQSAPKSPCGACLQVISEFVEDSGTPMLLVGKDGLTIRRSYSELVPYPCRIEGLKKNA